MFAAAGLGRSGFLSNHDAMLLPLEREVKTGREYGAIFDPHGIRCGPNFPCRAYRKSVVARGDPREHELAGCGSCRGILAVALRSEQLDGGHVDGISGHVAQDTAPGRRRRRVERGDWDEYDDKEKGTTERTGPRKHRETLYAGCF